MKQKCFYFFLLFLKVFYCFSQDAPNLANGSQMSGNTAATAKMADTRVDYFTGIPGISIPIYNYADKNGLSLNISANFTGGGGIRNGEIASMIGMGWNLSTGGIIARTVRGIPDDMPTYGFMYASAIPADFRSNGDKYYFDSLDAQQDVFQFSINGRSGKFVIGKNKQVVVTPASKMKIQFKAQPNQIISSFKIITEDGVKYIFDKGEQTWHSINSYGNTYYKSQYSGYPHYTAWYLSQIISPYNTDTIKFTYTSKNLKTTYSYPQVVFVKNSNNTVTATYNASGTNNSAVYKLSKISFPDKKEVGFIYSYKYKYDDTDYAIAKIKISDTVFRYGYAFDYQTNYTGKILKNYEEDENGNFDSSSTNYKTVLLLKSITPYTLHEAGEGYQFVYNTPFLSKDDPQYLANDSMRNAYDHWGYFNGRNNGTKAIPTVSPFYPAGAFRAPMPHAVQNSLAYMYLPSGGLVHYEYEMNSMSPGSATANQVAVTGNTGASQNNVSLSQLYNEQHQLVFTLDKTVSRTGSAPISGSCNLICNIKSTNGVTLYATGTFSMYDLYYQGIKTLTFNVPNGSYRLETLLGGAGSITAGSFPFTISWENKISSVSANTNGGIRIKRITKTNSNDTASYAGITQEFKYIMEDGNSSGFLGNIPKYDYPFYQTVTSTGTNTDMTALSSDPVNAVNFAEGNTVGYRRVEIINGTATKNMGKIVYEFTDLKDVNANYYTSLFPYAPDNLKSWGLGMPKRVLVYDSLDVLISKTTNQYSFNPIAYENTDFKSLKLGRSKITYATDPISFPTTARTNTYVGREYYVYSGWASLSSSTDTIFHPNGSVQTSYINYTYDTNYNVIKTAKSYDITKGLQLETRLYYPYNYTVGGAIGKLRDSGFITNTVASEKWITGDANPRLLATSITDFQQLAQGYIVPASLYALESNKPVAGSTIGVFNPTVLNRNSTYFKQQASFPLYDAKGDLLQTTSSVTNQSSCVILDYNNQYVVAKASLAVNSNIAYTSFESDGTGNWVISSSQRDKTTAITGKASYSLTNGAISKTGLDAAVTYIVTFWLKSGTVTVGSSAATTLTTHNGWSLMTKTLTGTTSLSITGTGLIDELRLHPDYCNMETYTYEPNVGVTSGCDFNNTIVYNEYDKLNRLKLVRDADKNIIKRMDYTNNSTLIDSAQLWVGTAKVCEANSAAYDSVYTDLNPYSDTYLKTINIMKGLDCSCPNPTPQLYKIINGICQQAYRVNTATYQVLIGNQTYWHCIYHYQWSDGSQLPAAYEDNLSPCPLGGGPD